ncbi:YbgA family protein [Staphylococcus sp. NRL 16/872]|uniref:YbgA family protein n=1 Tax=Staphylococcus sp. NRL 16/872 TaxID=2930131 RepID=UPI001FB1EF81|nr:MULTISPECIES: YbgA family protein [unclassified Staphylococcus]MCJ1655684.1 YbgA family protein [Staphylococcus sp. NRL 21/187]MCJ1661501.1 YbgA family protein [Staphylococcus sp. NRL 18/288]MCJ1667413.1 YbgA family protein [Staphylococcus sp. NRL 19/737]WEN69895.1 YbgA family protein [Staphylococcus sp. NRL 16/872]
MKERGYIEKLWREEKYHVLLHSQQYYNEIRELLKSSPSLQEVQLKIEEALRMNPTKGTIINAYDHMWGYFKNDATEEEKEKSKTLKNEFQNETITKIELLTFLKDLAQKYNVTYLLESHVLKIVNIKD